MLIKKHFTNISFLSAPFLSGCLAHPDVPVLQSPKATVVHQKNFMKKPVIYHAKVSTTESIGMPVVNLLAQPTGCSYA